MKAPAGIPELVALRSGRYVPLFGLGPTRDEGVRALANLAVALGEGADVRSVDHVLTLHQHPALKMAPLAHLADFVNKDIGEPVRAALAKIPLAYVGLLGASDSTRESVARVFAHCRPVHHEAQLALGMGGGDYSAWREHYALLCTQNDRASRVARAWFDWVLARRFSGLDALRDLLEEGELDGASLWLAETAFFVNGEDSSKERLVSLVDREMTGARKWLPRLFTFSARDLAESARMPMHLRWMHLRCSASRDHAAVSIRHWLAAATAQFDDDDGLDHKRALGPEPSRAGRAAMEARNAAGEFLLDWFVQDRAAREEVDAFARRIVRLYHRLRGALAFCEIETALKSANPPRSQAEKILWSQGEI